MCGCSGEPHLPLVLVPSPLEVLLLLGDLLLLPPELLLVLTLRFFSSRLCLSFAVGCSRLPEDTKGIAAAGVTACTWGVPCREAPALTRICSWFPHSMQAIDHDLPI